MRRWTIAIAMAAAVALTLPAVPAQAQFKGMDAAKPKATGRTEEGLKNDAEFDRAFRAKAGQRTPDVKTDPWADVRAPQAVQPTSKTKQ